MLPHYLAKFGSSNFGISDTARLLEQATPALIQSYLWPPNSPNLNPVDCRIWGIVQQRVYQSWVHNIDELKQRLLHVWHGHDQTIIDSAMMSGMSVFGQKTDTSSNYCDNIQSYDKRHFSFLSNVTRFLDCFFVNYHKFELLHFATKCGNILKVWWEVLYGFCWKFSSLSVKNWQKLSPWVWCTTFLGQGI